MKRKTYFHFDFDGSPNDCEKFSKLSLDIELKVAWEATCGRSNRFAKKKNKPMADHYMSMEKAATTSYEFMADYPITMRDISDFVYHWTVGNVVNPHNTNYGVRL